MTNAQLQHPNAALTPRQRRKMVLLVIDDGLFDQSSRPKTSPTEAAGASTAKAKHRQRNAHRPATGSYTPRSMTEPESSTPRSIRTNKPLPPSASGTAPTSSSTSSASPSSASSPTTDPARRMGLHPRLAHRPRTLRSLRALRPLLQSPPSTRRPRMVHTNLNAQGQRPRSSHLVHRARRSRRQKVAHLASQRYVTA